MDNFIDEAAISIMAAIYGTHPDEVRAIEAAVTAYDAAAALNEERKRRMSIPPTK